MPGTKIVCTIGPSSSSPDIIRKLIDGGMSVARLNFSHGSHDVHRKTIETIRRLSSEMNRPVAILQDLKGPKIRVGEIPDPGIMLNPGEELVLTNAVPDPSRRKVSISYGGLPDDVRPGDRILLADGLMEVSVERITESDIITRVITGGLLTSRKGINLPSLSIRVETFTDKDRSDLRFGLDAGVDYVALSFVRSAEDLQEVIDLVRGSGRDTPVIAKIEKHEAVENIDSILEAADGVMVARGDLGVEIPLEDVPNIQKTIVRKANSMGKPVIIATQMLRSMVDSPRPTRAEAADVANAVLDGADAVMLSEETASGRYPVAAVRYMARIIASAETRYPYARFMELIPQKGISESVAFASVVLADRLDAAAIVATTRSGFTAQLISRCRPRSRIIALCPEEQAFRRLALYWGCRPFMRPVNPDTDELIENAADSALDTEYVRPGDLVVITAGRPIWEKGTTNMLWVKKL